MESRYAVEGKTVDAKTPDQAVRRSGIKVSEGNTVTVIEWTGKTTIFKVVKKNRLVEVSA